MTYDSNLYKSILKRVTAGWGAGSEPGKDLTTMSKDQLVAYIGDLWARYDASTGRDKSKIAQALSTLALIDLPNLVCLNKLDDDDFEELRSLVYARGGPGSEALNPEFQLPNPGIIEPKP